jgi:hypothetical protein
VDSGTIRRWDGSRFVAGGTLRRWDGTAWHPDPNPWTPMLGLSPVLLWTAVDSSVVGPPLTLYGSVPVAGTARRFGAGRLETVDSALNLSGNFTVTASLRALPGNADGMAWMFGQESEYLRRALWIHGQDQANYSGYNANVVSGVNMSVRQTITVRRTGSLVEVFSGTTLTNAGNPAMNPFTYIGFAIGGNVVTGTEVFTGDVWSLAAFSRSITNGELATAVSALTAA